MRGSSKPCPGCGEVRSYRPAKEVCNDCKRLLERAEWLESKLDKLAEDKVVVAFGKHDYWNEYISTHSDTGRELRAIFHRLARASSFPSTNHSAEFNLLGRIEGGRCYAVMPAPLASAIRDLRVAVLEALELEYECGKSDGHNLLMRLANGDLSLNEFSKETE